MLDLVLLGVFGLLVDLLRGEGFVSLRDLLDGPGFLFDSGTESTPCSFSARLPCDRRAAPLPCKIPGGCQHLVVVPHVCLDACLLKTRLS